MANEVRTLFTGDDKDLKKTFDDVGVGAKEMADDVKKSSDRIEGAVDGSEGKFRGLGDAIGGTGDVMEGFRTGNVQQMAMGLADLAGAISVLVIPAMKSLATFLKGGLSSALSFVAAHPIILAVGALAAAFVVLWTNSETFRDVVVGVFEKVKSFVMPVIEAIGDALGFLGGLFGGAGEDSADMAEIMKESAQRSQDAWDRWKDGVASSLDSIVNPLQRAREKTKLSLEEIKANLNDNVAFYRGWIANLNLLTQRGFGELAAFFHTLGPEAEKAVGEATQLTNRQLEKLEASITGKLDSAGQRAGQLLRDGIGGQDYESIGTSIGESVVSGVEKVFAPGTLGRQLVTGGGLLGPALAPSRSASTGPTTIVVKIGDREMGRVVADSLRQNQLLGIS